MGDKTLTFDWDYRHCEYIIAILALALNDPMSVRALRNGDSIPNITPFASQSSIDLFLRKYIQGGKVILPDNQIIYLFEMYGSDTNASYFDLQDNVVLATIKVPQH